MKITKFLLYATAGLFLLPLLPVASLMWLVKLLEGGETVHQEACTNGGASQSARAAARRRGKADRWSQAADCEPHEATALCRGV